MYNSETPKLMMTLWYVVTAYHKPDNATSASSLFLLL